MKLLDNDFLLLYRLPFVALDPSGEIYSTDCNCPASRIGKCCHVGCLLYLINDITCDLTPKIDPACTSKKQGWGQGAMRNLNPQPLGETNYGEKRPDNRFQNIDPRKPENRDTTKADVDWFVSR